MSKKSDEIAEPILRALRDCSPSLRRLADIPRKLRIKTRGNQTSVRRIDRYDSDAQTVSVSVRRFNRNPEHRSDEFNDQLNEQIDTLENISLQDWLLNRLDYLRDGRPSASLREQRAVRDSDKLDAFREIMSDNPDMDPNLAKQFVEQWADTQAALHRLDGIAGGSVTDVSRLGDSNINSSLGSQWAARVGELDAAVISFMQKNPGVDLSTVFMDLSFY